MSTLQNRTIITTPEDSDRGPGTRRRLLDAAAQMFATSGYRAVSVRDICERACANIAAINYHFGGKDKLHAAALEHARERAIREAPASAGPKPAGPMSAEQRLRRHLGGLMERAFITGPAGWYMQIVLREMVDPTPALAATLGQALAPQQRRLQAIIAQVLTLDPDSSRVKDLASTVLATAIYYQNCRPAIELLSPELSFDQDTAQRVADTLTAMVVGSR